MKQILLKTLASVAFITSVWSATAFSREKHLFPKEFYEKRETNAIQKQYEVLAADPDDIYWTDISSQSGGIINYAFLMKVCDNALYVLGEEPGTGFADIVRYTKKDGWSTVCEIDVNGSLSTFSVDGDDIYIGGNFISAGPKQIPARNIVRYNIKSKGWYPMGEGLWDPEHPNVANIIQSIEAYKGEVFLQGRYSHTGDKKLASNYLVWNGNDYYPDAKFTNIVRHDSFLYDFAASLDTTKNIISLYVDTWDGENTIQIRNKYKLDIVVRGGIYNYGFGIDSKKNYYFIGDYSYYDSTVYKTGTYFLGFIDNVWKLLGEDKWQFTDVYYADAIAAVDGDGQVYVGGSFSKGIGGDLTFKKQNIVAWNGKDWTTMGNGIRDYVSAITYYDGDVYVGGGFSRAGDKETNGFAKWSKKMVSDVEEQPYVDISEIHIFPNPASDYITVELGKETSDCRIDIYDLYGSCVGRYTVGNVGRSVIKTDKLSSGVYTVRVQYGDKTATKTIAIIK